MCPSKDRACVLCGLRVPILRCGRLVPGNKNMKNILGNSSLGFTKWCVALIAAGWMGAGNNSFATLNYFEDFTTAGVLTANGWTAFSGAGSSALTASSPGLNYVGLTSSGNAVTVGNSGEDAYKAATTSNTSGDLYASFLINVSAAQATGDYFVSFYSKATAGGGYFGRLFIKSTTGGYLLGVSKNSTTAVWDTTARSLNTTYLVVVKMARVGTNTSTTTDDPTFVFVNPALGGVEPSPTITGAVSGADTYAGIDGIALRQGSSTAAPTLKIGAIRYGTSWADVTPAGGSSSPSITPSVSTLTGFATTAGTASAVQTFTVTGANLSADVTVTAPTGFEVASDGATFAGSKILTQSAGAVSGTISVRIAASTAQGALASANVTLVSGATSANVAVSGTVTAAGTPSVTVSPSSATGLTNYVGQVSASTNYTVTGTNLVSNLLVSASTNAIEVSTNSSTGYTNSFSLAPSVDGTLTNTVYVRISALAPAGAVSATVGNVSGVASNNFTVSGTVTTPALTLVLDPTTVAENAGASASTGTVGIPASLSSNLVVNLASTNTAAATVQTSVTITAGQTSATFPIAAVANSSSYGIATTAIEASNSNYTTASATLMVTNVDVPPAPLAVKGWINEFHYDNANTDSGEFVEIVLAPGTSTSNVSVVLYNGFDGKPYTTGTPAQSTFALSQFLAGESSNGYTIYSLAIPGIQNGPDGLVLIIDGVPEDLVSYEGSFAATDGLAAGYTLPDIGIAQTGTEAVGSSLYRYGPGNTGRDFAWAKATVATPGQVNAGQTLGATGVQGTGTLAIANTTASSPFLTQNIFPKATAGQTVSLTLTGTLSSRTISSMSVVVPAAFTGLSTGNVTVSGTGAGAAATTLSGSTLNITGLVVDQLNPVTINIAGLTTPETSGDLANDGNYPFTVQTGVDGNLQSLLIQPIAVVTIPIANLGDVDASGLSLDVEKTVAVQGVCTEENFNSTSSTSAYLQSGQPNGILKAGINIFSAQKDLFVRGSEYVVTGSVLNYSGLTRIVVAERSQVVLLGTATAVPTPVTLTIDQLTAAHEAYEGSLVRVVGLSKVSGTWALTVVGTVTSGSNIILANSGVNLTTRLNVGSTALTEPIYPTAITGIYGQFVAVTPFTGGGQIQPRDQADIQDAPGLRLTFAEAYLFESTNPPLGGSIVSGALTVSRTGADTSAALVVALSASPTGLLKFPASVTIPAGQETATVTVEAIDNSGFNAAGFTNVTLTASALGSGLGDGSATIIVLEDEASAPADTERPLITLIGANPQLVANGAVYTDLKATVTDNVDASREITGTGTVNTAVAGDYTITYNASDAAGNAAIAVLRTVTVAGPVVVESTYADWSGGSTLDSAGLAKYAIGGASSLTANDGVKPTTALTGGFLVITAIVRTDNSSLTVVGQAVTDLANYASGTGLTTLNGVETTDQAGVPTGHKRKTFSVAQETDARKFMRLSASLALSGTNTTVSVARDSGGATFLQVTGATAGSTSGGTATSDKRTVYYFASDTTSSPTYAGGAWPYVIVQGQLSAGAEVTATLTKNSSGVLLVNGRPAYQYIGNSSSSTANAVSGTWPAMKADGTKTMTGPSGTIQ